MDTAGVILLQAVTTVVDKSEDFSLYTLVGPIVGALLALLFNWVLNFVKRSWDQSDKLRESDQKDYHDQLEAIRVSHARELEIREKSYMRELDRIHEQIGKVVDTLGKVQQALLKVELRVESMAGYVETRNEVTRVVHGGLADDNS